MNCGIAVDTSSGRELVRSILNDLCQEIWEAGDSDSAIVMALRHRPDLLIVEVGLCAIDGVKIAAEVRGAGTLATTKIIAFTGSLGETHQSLLIEGLVDRLLVKPIRAAILRAAIAELIASQNGRYAS